MSNRVFWPIAGVFALAFMALVVSSQSSAQRRPQPEDRDERPQPVVRPGFMAAGRFVVAHATEKQIVILDTATGQLYKATDKDIKAYKDLPRPGPVRVPVRERGREQPKERPARDRGKEARPKEKGERPKEKGDRPKEKKEDERKERGREKDQVNKRGLADLGKGEPASGKKDR